MRRVRIVALLLAVALMLCACQSKEETAYRAAKKKLEKAQNLWGSTGDEERDATWQEALEALEAVGDYEDAPALADEARDYFYDSALWWFWEIGDHEDALDRVRAYLDAIPGYRDTADWAVLEAALRLAMDGKVEEGAELARTLPEGFEDNLFRNTILLADDCRLERWLDALDKAQPLYQQTLPDGKGNSYSERRSCQQTILWRSDLEIVYSPSTSYKRNLEEIFEAILLRYYGQQTDLGNDITALEAWPCETPNDNGFAKSAFGTVKIDDLYWDRAHRMEESMEQYGVTEEYATIGDVTTRSVARFKNTLNGVVIDGFEDEVEVLNDRIPTPPTEITGSGICFLETGNSYDGVKVDVNDLRYRIAPFCLADSVESARYICRIYHDKTRTHFVRSSTGGEGGLYDDNASVQLIDLKTGVTLTACEYHESQAGHTSNRDETLNRDLLPALREIVTVY